MLSGCVFLLALEILAVPPQQILDEQQIVYTGGEYKDEVFKYRLLTPKQIEDGKKYPLILYLHGAGERGQDNIAQLAYLPEQMSQPAWRADFPCFLIAPQCRPDKKWVEVDWGEKTSRPQQAPTDQMQSPCRSWKRSFRRTPSTRREFT